MNLERQIKRRLIARPHTAWIHAGPGCAQAVEAETGRLLHRLETAEGPPPSATSSSDGIRLKTIRYRSLLEVTMRLTTAQDVSLLVGTKVVHNRVDLARLLEGIDWQFFVRQGDTVFLRCDSRASTLYHEGIIRESATDRLSRFGARVVTGPDSAGAHRVTVRIEHDRGSVRISLAGEPLWKRGYRAESSASAPLREDLAQMAIRTTLDRLPGDPGAGAPSAALRPTEALFVPFSGSGTLLMEYLIACFDIPPFVFRADYAFERFPALPPPSVGWVQRRLLERLAGRLPSTGTMPVRLVDRDPAASASAEANFRRFMSLLGAASRSSVALPVSVEYTSADVFARPWRAWLPAAKERVFLPMNPPYGRRLATRSTDELYRRIGAATVSLADSLPTDGLSGFLLCPTETSWRSFLQAAMRLPTSTSHFSQGGLDIRLCRFASSPAVLSARSEGTG